MSKYKLAYRELFRQDMNKIYLYIAETLKAPQAAGNLLDDIEESVNRLATFPLAYRIFQHVPPLPEEFRMMPVKNYAVFYVVQGDTVEMRRIVYARMDLTKLFP